MRQHKANHALASIKSALHFRFSMSVFFLFLAKFLLDSFSFVGLFFCFSSIRFFFEEIFRSRFTRLDLNEATILLSESRFLSLAVTPWKNYWYWSKNHAVISFTGIVIRATNLNHWITSNLKKKMTNNIGKIWHDSTLSEMTHINSITSKIQLPLIHRYTK